MRNTILYTAYSTDEIHECAYSLLKYLDVYNMKPPADHSVVVYTNDPASLEGYQSYFSQFELKELYEKGSGPAEKMKFIKQLSEQYEGNFLYLGPNAYPVKPLEPVFASMNKGSVFLSRPEGEEPTSSVMPDLSLLGFNATHRYRLDETIQKKNTTDAEGLIEIYSDLREFRVLLNRFFGRYQEESIPNQVKLMHYIDAKKIQEQKMRFRKLPVVSRLIRKVLGTGWTISNYTKKMR
jgi:hypothetical protein